jgi:ectoine hydroxylase-related dioxygenase (phytanoyl-CoA dioxygenase family)
MPHVAEIEACKHALYQQGIVKISSVLSDAQCTNLGTSISASACDSQSQSGGLRNLLAHDWCQSTITQLLARPALRALLPPSAIAVQCNYFKKSFANNWAVAMHQDTIIPVAARVNHPALKGWSLKQGQHFVQAPSAVLEQMVAFRLHLDTCYAENGALRVVTGSHRQGILFSTQIAQTTKDENIIVTCAAGMGDVWAMHPLVLHASSRVTDAGPAVVDAVAETLPSRINKRRVLHLVFAPPELPYGLSWPNACSAAK